MTILFGYSGVGFFIAMIYKARAFFALSVTYDGLSRLPQYLTIPTEPEGGIKQNVGKKSHKILDPWEEVPVQGIPRLLSAMFPQPITDTSCPV